MWLILMEPLTPLFITVYTLTGVTDVLDGAIARKYGTTSELGAKLDSIADLLFYTLILIMIFPIMWVTLPKKNWVMVAAILTVRGVSYGMAAVKYHRFAAMHTYMNKATGLMVFGVPYAIEEMLNIGAEVSLSIFRTSKEIPGLLDGNYDRDKCFKEVIEN